MRKSTYLRIMKARCGRRKGGKRCECREERTEGCEDEEKDETAPASLPRHHPPFSNAAASTSLAHLTLPYLSLSLTRFTYLQAVRLPGGRSTVRWRKRDPTHEPDPNPTHFKSEKPCSPKKWIGLGSHFSDLQKIESG